MTSTAGERGMALPLVLMLILALTVLGYGALSLATSEARGSRAAVHQLQARLLAEGTARLLEGTLLLDSLPRTPLWSERPLVEGSQNLFRYGASLMALGPEWHLVVGWSRRGMDGARHRAALVLWSMDPASRVARAQAVVRHGGPLRMSPGAWIGTTNLLAPEPGGTSEACAPLLEALDSLLAPGSLPRALPVPEVEGLAGRAPRIGLLDAGELLERLSPRPPGVARPAPVVTGGVCDPDAPDNWGAPSAPGGACGERRISVMVAGDLHIPAGEGQGLLVVDGSLHLGEVLFAGMIVVRDTLVLGAGSRVAGLVEAHGPVLLEQGARIDGRACAAGLALARSPALRPPVPLALRPWVRPFGGAPPSL